MRDKDKNILERAAIAGLAVPAGLMGGEMISDAMEGQMSKVERKSKRDEDVKRMKDKFGEKEPTGSAKESLSRERNYKKGGAVKSSASKRADGIAQRGKTKGRMV